MIVNFLPPSSSFLSFFKSFFPLSTVSFGYGLRFAPPAAKKDAVAIGARRVNRQFLRINNEFYHSQYSLAKKIHNLLFKNQPVKNSSNFRYPPEEGNGKSYFDVIF